MLNEHAPNNPLLGELLEHQQDGAQAISSPRLWLKTPKLFVESESLEVARQLVDEIMVDYKPPRLRWHFFIGAPGNGKSAATGAMVRRLVQKFGCQIKTPSGTAIQDIGPEQVPLLLEVNLNDEKTPTLLIAQDASVVKNPFSAKPDPAEDLLSILLDAANRKLSLVACTNRGILERTAGLAISNGGQAEKQIATLIANVAGNHANPAGRILDTIALQSNADSDAEIDVSQCALDTSSLLFSNAEGKTCAFEELIVLAIGDSGWNQCAGCEAADICPFLANRNSLSAENIRRAFIRILQDAELLSGQLIVFREANALLSLMLAGCASDYGTKAPCSWVQEKARDGSVFILAARRIHMLLFSSNAPLGLEEDEILAAEQLGFLRNVADRMVRDTNFELPETFSYPSRNTGVARLLGSNGILRQLDPLSCPLSEELAERWEYTYPETSGISQLEFRCQSIWNAMDEAIAAGEAGSQREAAALARWRSAHTIRLGALLQQSYGLKHQLDEYRATLAIDGPLPTAIEKSKIRKRLSELLHRGSTDIPLSTHVHLESAGKAELQLVIDWVKSKAERALHIRYGETTEHIKLSARAYVWLELKRRTGLSETTFPIEWIEAAQEAIARVAAASGYSKRTDVTIVIEAPDGSALRLSRQAYGEAFAETVDTRCAL